MNKTRKRKQPKPFIELSLRDQWRQYYAKKSLIGFNNVFGLVYDPLDRVICKNKCKNEIMRVSEYW
jgi:hypothetical protein